MKKVFQLWGIEPEKGMNEQETLKIVDRMLDARPDYLVAGQTKNRSLLQGIVDRAHARGVKVHQWSSLFSEFDDAADFDVLLGADGKRQERVYGNNFNFRCPASQKNVELFIEMEKEEMRGVNFDGVFIDRVRYPSFGNGALACFCPECVKRYEADGIDVDAIRQMTDYGIIGFEKGRHVFDDPNKTAFFRHRADRILDAVKRIKEVFGEVSLDLFPPALAYLMGQDAERMNEYAEFIKPMLYRYTTAPAGLPFEMDLFDGFKMSAEDQVKAYESAVPGLMWGVEGGMIPGIAEMTPERIRESIALIKENGGTGLCASWASVHFPKENLDAFLEA